MSENFEKDWNDNQDSNSTPGDTIVAEEAAAPKTPAKAKAKPAKAKAKPANTPAAKVKANPTITAVVANRVLSAFTEVETMDGTARMLLSSLLDVPDANNTAITVALVGGAVTLGSTVDDINTLRAEEDAMERGYLWDALGRDRSRNAWAAMHALALVETPKAPTSDVRAAFTAVSAISTVDSETAESLEHVALLCATV